MDRLGLPLIAARIGYLLLSVFAGLLELGVLLLAIRSHWPLIALPLAAIAYQSGALLVDPLGLKPSGFLALGLAGSAFLYFIPSPEFPLALLPIALVSAGIQGGRDVLAPRAQVNTLTKRSSRVVGFLISGILSFPTIIWLGVVSAAILLTAIVVKIASPTHGPTRLAFGPEAAVMLVHQAHYFCYAAIMPLLLVQTRLVPIEATGFLFSIGWISYALAPSLLRRTRLIRTFVLGHCFAALVLIGIALLSRQPLALLCLWFLTGLGGGTVFVLRAIEHRSQGELGLDGWENLGHIVGLVLSAAVVSLLGAVGVFPTAALVALVTAGMMHMLSNRHGWARSLTEEHV